MSMTEILKSDPCHRCDFQECSYNLRMRWSLTNELNRGGCAHHYMKAVLPELARYTRYISLPKGRLLAEAPKHWEPFAGTAFDRRLRYEYEPDYIDGVTTRGVERLGWDSRIVEEGLQSEDLDVRALYAAVADTESRRSGRGLQALYDLMDNGENLREQLIEDIQKLMGIARDHLPLRDPKFGIDFGVSSTWIGGADADIVDDGCLIDIKCVKTPKPTEYLRQAIAYTLLDVDDEHRLDSVGIYLARQGIFWKVPLDDIAKQAGTTLQELRDNAPWGNPADREALRRKISKT